MKSILRWFLQGLVLTFVSLGAVVLFILSFQGDVFKGQADCGVIFGAAVWRDDTPSHALYDRVMAGVDLYKQKQVACLVLSGGPSIYGAHEVDVMKKIVLENNISEEVLILDYKGLSTEKTLDNIADKTKSYVMISNDFHLARINIMAWKKEFDEVFVHAAPYRNGRYRKEAWFTFREIGGLLYTIVFVWK